MIKVGINVSDCTQKTGWETIMRKENYARVFTFLLCIIISGYLFLISACATSQEEKGAKNHWRNPDLPAWKVGRTTENNVIDALGPPSQIIALNDQTVYYYMQEQSVGKAYIFIVWNRSEKTIRYDRAVFFFNKNGILNKYSYSPEAFPYDPAP